MLIPMLGGFGSAGAVGGASLFLDTTTAMVDGDPASSYTFTVGGSGLPSNNVGVCVIAQGNNNIASITIGGTSGTSRESLSPGGFTRDIRFFDATPTSGNDIVVTMSGSEFRCGIIPVDLNGLTYAASNSDSANPGTSIDLSVATTAGDTVVVFCGHSAADFTGFTGGATAEEFETNIESTHYIAGALTQNAAGGSPEAFGAGITTSTGMMGLSAVYR